MKYSTLLFIFLFSFSILKAQENIESPKITQKVNFYPNPVKSNLFIKYANTASKKKIKDIIIINVLGQKVKHFPSFNQKSVNLSTLPRGIYFIRYSLEKKIFSYKFVKN